MANALAVVQDTFLTLDTQYDELWAACRTQTERDQLGLRYSTTQADYQRCVGQVLSDDDPDVAALSKQLAAANAVVAKAVEQMGNMSKVLDEITDAINIGAKLLAKIP